MSLRRIPGTNRPKSVGRPAGYLPEDHAESARHDAQQDLDINILKRRHAIVAAAAAANLVPGVWYALPLEGSCTIAGDPYHDPQYRFVFDDDSVSGIDAQLRGSVNGCVVGDPIGRVPVALAPTALVPLLMPAGSDGTQGAWVTVDTDRYVTLVGLFP